METVKKIANIIFWILLVTLILTLFLSNLAVIQIGCIIGIIIIRVFIVEGRERDWF